MSPLNINNHKNRRDDTQLICNIGELSGLFTDSTTLETFLQRIAATVAEHMQVDVCSIYLYNEASEELVLKATKGLNRDFIGKLKLKLGEGLTGLALKELRPICERQASENSNFRYFPGLGEEKYESFLAVPILRGTTMIGTLVIQNIARNFFDEEDINVMRAITSQLANTIEVTRLFLSFQDKQTDKNQIIAPAKDLKFIKGKRGSPGFAFGEAIVLKDNKGLVSHDDPKFLKKYTLQEFYQALQSTEKELEELQKQIEEKLSDVASLIFTAQILMLKDNSFTGMIADLIKKGKNPPQAIKYVTEYYMKKFEGIENAYLQEKRQDVCDIGNRLLENLIGKDQNVLEYNKQIVIARELFPSDALKLSSQNVKGIILLTGGATSHLAILVRSLEIPLIIADFPDLLNLPQKTKILMDANQGDIYVNPSSDIINAFKGKTLTSHELVRLKKSILPTTTTKDGTRVYVMANVNLLNDVKNALDFKAEGIGLYRTEFPFIARNDFPSEEEQYVIYKKLVEAIPNREITFRTLDIGGDKILSYFELHLKEKNPYLGMRSIRFSLQHVEIFSQQIRAILRAGHNANIRIMFPMICSVDEFLEAKRIVLKCLDDLEKEEIRCARDVKIGLMVELPAVLEVIEELAQEADFFSIGTNDLIQYMLAVDRTNEKVANLYLPHHPAILRALKKVVNVANQYAKDVSICGDMVHEERYLNYLLGIGIRKLSLDTTYIPKIKNLIQTVDIHDAEELSEEVLKESRLTQVSQLLQKNKPNAETITSL